jgi:hypothetical protein
VSERNHRPFWKINTNHIVFYFSPHDTQCGYPPSVTGKRKKEREKERKKEIHQFAMPSATGITRIRPALA